MELKRKPKPILISKYKAFYQNLICQQKGANLGTLLCSYGGFENYNWSIICEGHKYYFPSPMDLSIPKLTLNVVKKREHAESYTLKSWKLNSFKYVDKTIVLH